jgi:hypothetical protein
MNSHSISRTVVNSSLRLVRLPIDGVLRLGGDSTAEALIAVDRAEAGVRGAVGVLLRDEVMTRDADLRRSAADERRHALRLRAEAEFHADHGERETKQASEEGKARRRQADKAAKQRSERARKLRDARKSKAATKADSRKQAARRDARVREQVAAERSKRDRLEAVERKSEALDKKAGALATSDEAQRLQKAASKVKANRKSAS